MPSVYAHYKFGVDVLPLLPTELQRAVHNYRELYDLGLQGPDLLFFYHPIVHNYVNRLGNAIHLWTGKRYFEPALRILRAQPHKQAAIAYMTGALCHYALDSLCHAYIEECVKSKGLRHTAMEGSFDRLLILEDHHPYNHLVSVYLRTTKAESALISHFYGKTTGKQLYRSIRTMQILNDGLRLPDSLLKKAIFLFLRLIGKYDTISGMVITKEADPRFQETDQRLRQIYDESIPYALEIIQEFMDAYRHNTSLGEHFQITFMGQ